MFLLFIPFDLRSKFIYPVHSLNIDYFRDINWDMAEYSVKFPSNEEIQPHKIPDITQLMEALLAAVSGIANEGFLDAHECEGKCV